MVGWNRLVKDEYNFTNTSSSNFVLVGLQRTPRAIWTMTADVIPHPNLVISALYLFEGVSMLWNPEFWLPIAFVNGSDIHLDSTHKMFCMWIGGMMFALSAAFCTLDGRKPQTRALVTGNGLLLLLCLRVHFKISISPCEISPFSYSVPNTATWLCHFSRPNIYLLP